MIINFDGKVKPMNMYESPNEQWMQCKYGQQVIPMLCEHPYDNNTSQLCNQEKFTHYYTYQIKIGNRFAKEREPKR